MRLLSEELRTGTAETLAAAPVSDACVVWGKYLGGVGFLVLILRGYAGHESRADRAYRGDFDEETIRRRLAEAQIELDRQDEFDWKVVNDDSLRAAREIGSAAGSRRPCGKP